ncbi:heavy metal translocating P-type ATPase [Waddlia chondrophila]|uniref:Heavy metal translocating P-type ATPase n=1 Tax=Waddlia chondrophila (strain ATCC VR-1470 / WSU 86-1044) TaxID=716544 RepID=D6YWJ7_WADCW|nr:cation-translocating P-type ATPase [Waddlia chondrophila]ADI38508.1 heavy metal translocating P-type ATPase [Waddlia chondrophila WSU 86-1044]
MQCSLCAQEIEGRKVVEEENAFCCAGCRAVFKILSASNQLEGYADTPIFKQAVATGLISNPALMEQLRKNRVEVSEEEKNRLYLEIGDMWCPACAEVIRLILLQKKGVLNCVVDYATDLASIEYAPRYVSKETLIQAIERLGYETQPIETAGKKQVSRSLYLRLIVAIFFSSNIMMFSYPIYAAYFTADETGISSLFVWLSLFSSLPVLIFSAWPIFRRFFTALSVGVIGMEALIVIGVSSAFGLSLYEMSQGSKYVYFDSMCVIIAFVLLGKVIETRAKFSAKDSLIRLARAVPKRGRKRFEDGREAFIPLKEMKPGDLLVAHTGEKIVLDGVLVSGKGACDESLMTGESVPIPKEIGDSVLGGTVVVNGSVVYQATATEKQTALQRIIQMVEQDIGHKSVYTRAVDPIVNWFIPIVLAIAAGTIFGCWLNGLSWEAAIVRGISILLISCPCAIGIAAPLAESQLLNGMATLGAIVRNRGCLPDLGRETAMVFDKTGTITKGKFEVLRGLDTIPKAFLPILKGLASRSNHPVSVAIDRDIFSSSQLLDDVMEIAGKGIEGVFNGKIYRLGHAEWTGCVAAENEAVSAGTQVCFSEENRLIGTILLGDQVREEAQEVVEAMKPARRILLSGDGKLSVEQVAEECGFDEWKWRQTPLEKREMIERLREEGCIVGMVGDGINDAPSLTGAHVGISVVTASDISVQVSDILLTTDHLKVLPKIHVLARKGRKVIKQNLFWAFFYNVIGIGFAVSGYLSPIFSAAAMVLSSLMVLFNARRIR